MVSSVSSETRPHLPLEFFVPFTMPFTIALFFYQRKSVGLYPLFLHGPGLLAQGLRGRSSDRGLERLLILLY